VSLLQRNARAWQQTNTHQDQAQRLARAQLGRQALGRACECCHVGLAVALVVGVVGGGGGTAWLLRGRRRRSASQALPPHGRARAVRLPLLLPRL
jgi:hypothetical protein